MQNAPGNNEVGSLRIKQEVIINASAEKVWDALTGNMGAWWGAPYLLGEPRDIICDKSLGGMVREDWGNGDGAVWGFITQWKKNSVLEFTGRMGMGGSVTNVVCFELVSQGGSTLVKLEHDGVGHVTEKTVGGYSYGWSDLVGKRLKSLVETGEKLGVRK